MLLNLQKYESIDKSMFPPLGRFLNSKRIRTRQENGKELDELGCTEITYLTRLEALQAVTMVNQNRVFNPNGHTFLTSDTYSECMFSSCFGLGQGGVLLDVKGISGKSLLAASELPVVISQCNSNV